MFHHLTNTAQFSYTARDFMRNGGQYTKAPVGSREYIEFWEEEERRCREGYTVGGLWIPGRYYGYLNFSIMSKVPDAIAIKAYNERKDGNGKVSIKTAEKIIEFPRFWEVQYEWFMFKHIAWNGGQFMGIESPGGKHIGCLKARGGGFSYMEAWDAVYNYNFIPGSKSYIFAGIEQYLNVDGTMNKVRPMLDWINQHSQEWKQNRQVHDTDLHFKASYKDAFSVEQGNMGEIIGITVNDADKAHPYSANIITPDGPRKWKDIQEGDRVFGANGNIIIIEDVFEQGVKDIYKVTFEDGRTVNCTYDHLWTISRWTTKKSKKVIETSTLSLSEIDRLMKLPGHSTNRIKIQMNSCTDYPAQPIPMDSYTLGLMLGDGCIGKATKNISPLTMLHADLESVAATMPYKVERENWGTGIRNKIYIPDGKQIYKELGLFDKKSGTKFIPDIYKYNSKQVRLDVINGLLDTDGSVTKDFGIIEYSTKSRQMADDFIWIIHSLGYGGTIKYKIINGTKYYRCYVYCRPDETELFRLPRKKARLRNKKANGWGLNKSSFVQIKSIEYSHRELAKCIRVSAEDHLYLIEDHIVTHNTRGKRGRKILFEEGGSFRDLKKAIGVSLGSIRDGDLYVGQQTVIGTGGEEGPDIEGLEEVFDNPAVFDMLEFPNTHDGGELSETTCGYFCPAYRVNNATIDADGNVDVHLAIELEKKQRAKKRRSKDPKDLDRYVAEYPWTPQEALKRLTNNPFKSSELNKQIRFVKNSPMIQSLFRYGYMARDKKGKAVFIPQTKEEARPIETYPHRRGDDLTGCVTVVERPYQNERGQVPHKMYQVIFDGFAIEETSEKEDTGTNESLYTIYVLKNYNNIDPINEGMPVAWFRGRREDLNELYEITLLLCEWYNTEVQGEIGGGGQGLVNYARVEKKLHLLEKEPEMSHNKEYQSRGRVGSYLMAMPTEKKRLGITYVVDWHREIRAIDEDGNKVMRLHRWYDIVGMMELAKFNGKRNADTLSCLIIGVIMLKENSYREAVESQEEEDDYYSRDFYDDNAESTEEVVSLG